MSSLQRWLLVGVVGVALVGVVALLVVERSTRLDRAIARLGDEDRFGTSAEAGQTVADISTQLRAEGGACRDKKHDPARCAALLSAAAFTAVTSVALLECTAPDVYDARVALRDWLRRLRDYLDDGARGAAPALPKVITC